MISVGLKSAEAFSRAMERKIRRVERNVRRNLGEAGNLVVGSAKKKSVVPSKRLNKQDNPNQTKPRPPRIAKKRLSGGISVTMGGAWGYARDPLVVKIMRQTGNYHRMVRKHLTVESPLIGGGVDAPRKLRFKDTPWLEEWGEREDRGKQRLRHAVRLPPEVRMRLTLGPAMDENRQRVDDLLTEALLRGLG